MCCLMIGIRVAYYAKYIKIEIKLLKNLVRVYLSSDLLHSIFLLLFFSSPQERSHYRLQSAVKIH